MEEDSFFSDDDLDNIPTNTLDALESQAISATQRPPTSSGPSRQPLRKQAHNATSLNKSSTTNQNVPYRPPSSRPPPASVRHNGLPGSLPQLPSSDYGFDDEDVIDLDEPSMVIQSASNPNQGAFKQGRQGNGRYASKLAPDPETEAAFAAADAEMESHTFGRWTVPEESQSQAGASLDVSAMQARIAELEAEQARLRMSEQEARAVAEAKKGEIAIIRSNLQKTSKTYEDRIAVMQRLHAQETAKQKAELEVGRKEREQMQTDNRFLQHEAAQEAERAKRLNGPGRVRSGPSNRDTPRKDKRGAFGDGFDDDEVQRVSPSRSRDKSREQTPRTGAKRKRAAQDSPIPLALAQPPRTVRQESSEQTAGFFEQASGPVSVSQEDGRYEYMQRMLNHRPRESEGRNVELLTKHNFPSQRDRSIAAILLDDMSASSADDKLPLSVSRTLLSLWAQCLEENYFLPFYLILDLLCAALHSELLSARAQLIEEALPLCTKTIDLVTLPTAKASANKTFAATLNREELDRLAEEISIDDVFDFMKSLCDAATLSPERLETFWQLMEWDPLILMLNKAQPIHQIIIALEILQTSTLSTSFGPISADPEQQATQEKNTIDKLTNLLFEVPELPASETAYTDAELNELRVHVLYVFRAMCQTPHASLLLAQHRSFIGRLVRFLHGQVCKLYTLRPSVGNDVSSPDPQTHDPARDLVLETINLSVHLLHHVLRTQDVNVEEKLRVVLGGYHKFLVALTRIAFTEQLVFEQGIEDQAAEAAHAVLDHVLGPEDGEAVMRAVETPRGTRGSVEGGG